MTQMLHSVSAPYKEVIFQIVLHALVFLFYSFDKSDPQIKLYQLGFFLNYAFVAFVINYLFLPRFYYRKKPLLFFACVALALLFAILMEEFVVERIFFPDTRGRVFYGFFFTLLDVLPIIVILSGFKFAWDALGKQSEVDQLKAAVKESELQFLKSQINPHFLFNNLNNLYAYAIENSPKTPEIILELSGFLRYMLYECRAAYVPLNREVEQMENFIRLNEMQVEERGEINFSSENIQSTYQIAPLILIVFIENAFKHSTASQRNQIEITVRLSLSPNGLLNFSCSNSYREQSNTEQLSKGIGLENVRKRLALIYPNAHQLDIQKTDQRYQVQLSIDLNKKS